MINQGSGISYQLSGIRAILLALIADAARLLHLPRAVLRAGSAVGDDAGQRGREPAGLLQACRRTSLRHEHADGRDDGEDCRSAAFVFRSFNLPPLSGPHDDDPDAGTRAYGRAGKPTGHVDVRDYAGS